MRNAEEKHLPLLSIVLCTIIICFSGCRDIAPTAHYNHSPKDSVAGDYLSARFAMQNQDIEHAVEYFSSALAKDPQNDALLNRGYRLMLLAGEMEKAVQLARRYVAQHDDLSTAHILLASHAVNKGRLEDAEAILTPFFEMEDPTQISITSEITVPLMLSWIKAGEKQYDKAFEILKGLEETAAGPFVPYHSALIYELSGNDTKAEKIYTDLIDTQLNSYRLTEAAYRFFTRLNKFSKANEIKEQYIADNPTMRFHHVLSGNYTGSMIGSAKQGIAEMFLEIASFLYANSTQMDNAMAYTRLSLIMSPDVPSSQILLANIFRKTGQDEQAISTYKSIKYPPMFVWQARLNTAKLYFQNKQTDKAKSVLLTMAEERKRDYTALITLGDLLLENEEFNAAAGIYTKALERIEKQENTHWVIYYARGISYERDKQWPKAEADFRKALELSPQQPDVLNYLAYSWLVQEINYKEAEEMLRTALTQRPDDAHIIDSYGWVLFKLSKYAKALNYIEKANLMIPQDPVTNDHLGDVYWKLGRYTEARYQWERALSFDPKEAEAAKIQQKLEHGLDASPPIALNGDDARGESKTF
jgi:tetratricopeptide (TPR) repeat protein